MSRVALVLLLASCAHGAGPAGRVPVGEPTDLTRREILAAEERIFGAIQHKDVGALRPLLAPEFVHRSPSGEELGKEAFLAGVGAVPLRIVSVRGENMAVRAYGSTALLTGVQRAVVLGTDGREMASDGAFTDVFVLRRVEGKRVWLLSFAYSVELPPPALPAPPDPAPGP
ncbi:MAG TPA: nuclear transport factor 2 family protein [Polyangia bacterium]|nr:nuclear transport factor 2 family protein [Polyangia bacterium]